MSLPQVHVMANVARVTSKERFSRFLKIIRIGKGFETWESFSDRADIGASLPYEIMRDGPDRPQTSDKTRNRFAKGLGYKDWRDLIDDFASRGTDLVAADEDELTEFVLPQKLLTAIRRAAAKKKLDLELWLWEQVHSQGEK